MAIGAELTQALRSFAALEQEIVDLGQRVEPANAMAFVRMRRQLVMGFAALSSALDRDAWLTSQSEVYQRGRQLFSAFRAANSINQANWPVIMARDDPKGYEVAARPVAEKSNAFWAWAEQELGFRR
ncbi:MAG TPA: hypothetical protein VFF89_03570 [Sphingobium sp.]|nr:hypothetical protein [Sphingobium sp.]